MHDKPERTQKINKIKIKVLRSIRGISLRDKQRTQTIREQCDIQNVSKFMKNRRTPWAQYVIRMSPQGLPKICRKTKHTTEDRKEDHPKDGENVVKQVLQKPNKAQ